MRVFNEEVENSKATLLEVNYKEAEALMVALECAIEKHKRTKIYKELYSIIVEKVCLF